MIPINPGFFFSLCDTKSFEIMARSVWIDAQSKSVKHWHIANRHLKRLTNLGHQHLEMRLLKLNNV